MVVRITKLNTIGNARPCINCLKMMKDLNIKKVHYSSGRGNEIISENVKNMISIELSSIGRKLHFTKSNIQDRNEQYEFLLKDNFPKVINNKNLQYFINYNFKNIFPNYIIKYKIINNVTFIYIYNTNDQLIISSQVL
jgi:hypothetical protein